MSPISRRGFVKSAGMAAALAMLGVSPASAAESQRKPNVVFILSDDHGSIDLNCYGAKDLITPNLDKLASEGVRLTQFYAASSVCSPSRAAILTGRYPQRAGLPSNAGHHYGEHGMPTQQVTIAEMLKAAGYVTGHIGKWHLGFVPEEMPNAQGFDYSFGHMGGCLDNYSHFYYWGGPNCHDLWRNGQEVWQEGAYFGDLMVREAAAFMEKNKDKPFFLYFASNKPHYPLQGTAKWREAYKNLPEPRNMYAAAVSTVDEEVGKLLAKLDELGLRDDTIVIFQSDQGHSTEIRTYGGGGNAGPYRGAKGDLFEGGIRIPAIIRWPGKLPQGEVRGQLCTGCDWLPTIAALCGVKPQMPRLDGASIVDVIRSKDATSPHAVWHWQLNQKWAVREGNWKLLGNPSDSAGKQPLGKEDQLFLVNLAQDIGEKANVAKAHPEIVQRLKKLHEAWVEEVKAQ